MRRLLSVPPLQCSCCPCWAAYNFWPPPIGDRLLQTGDCGLDPLAAAGRHPRTPPPPNQHSLPAMAAPSPYDQLLTAALAELQLNMAAAEGAAAALVERLLEAGSERRIAVHGVGREGLALKGLAMRLYHMGLQVGVQAQAVYAVKLSVLPVAAFAALFRSLLPTCPRTPATPTRRPRWWVR